MHVSKPVWKNEYNVTTVIALVMFAATVGGWVYSSGQQTASIASERIRVDTWIANHEQIHKDRLATVSGIEARVDQRLTGLEASVRKQDNIEYRLTVVEQGSANLARSVEELKATVNNLGTDIRVIREILERP